MSRISTYPIDTVVDTADLLIGTDSEDQNITKNYTIASIISLAESSIDLAEVLAVGNTATNNINLTGIMTATTVNGTNGTIGVFSSTTGTIVTLGSTTGNITTVNSTNIVNSALVSTANLTATAGITNNLLYIDSLGGSGAAGQVLKSTSTATEWGDYQPPSRGYFSGRNSTNITVTEVALVNNYYVLNFDWTNIVSNLWSDRTNGSGYDSGFQYTGTPAQLFNIICSFSVSGFDAGELVTFALYKNGVILPGSEQNIESSSLLYSIGTLQSMVSLSTNDYIEIWVKCTTTSTIARLETISASAVAV